MLRYQQCKVGVLCLLVGSFVAVAVYGDDAVGVLIYDDTVGIHTEGTHGILEFFSAVYDLALIEFIGQMREDDCGQFHPDADIHAVGLGVDVQIFTDLLHPFAAAAAYGNNALVAVVRSVFAADTVTVTNGLHRFHRGIEIESHFILQFCVQIFQHDEVDICTQVTYGSV